MNFVDDDEKMRDFFILSKDEFLKSYSYLSEQEYKNTLNVVKNDMKQKIEMILKNDEDYLDYKLQYMIINENEPKKSYGIGLDESDSVVKIDFESKEINDLPYWCYDISEDIFEELELGNKIGYITLEVHYAIWESINYYYPEDINHKKGMQMYLKYCKENEITKDKILDKIKVEDIKDVMRFYKKDKRRIDR